MKRLLYLLPFLALTLHAETPRERLDKVRYTSSLLDLRFDQIDGRFKNAVVVYGTQTIRGNKTFSDTISVSTVAATNSPSISSPSAFKVYRNAALTITNGAETQIPYDTEVQDYQNLFSTSSGSATVRNAGGYLVCVNPMFQAMDADARALGYIKVNGTTKHTWGGPASVSTDFGPGATCTVLVLAAGDTVAVYVRHESAAGKAMHVGEALNSFSAVRLW